jgi:hypothetical protein
MGLLGEAAVEAPTADNAPIAPAGNDNAPKAPSFNTELPENWFESLDEDVRGEPLLKGFKDVRSMAKSLVHAQRMVGKDKIVVPDKHATDEQWKEIYTKLGLPESPDEYEVEVDDELLNESDVKELLADLYGAGVLPKQAQAIVSRMEQQVAAQREQLSAQMEQEEAAAVELLQKEWGENFNSNITRAQAAVKEYGGEQMMSRIDASGLGNDPEFIKMMAKVGMTLREDVLIDSGIPVHGATIDEAARFVNDVQNNLGHPYWDDSHPNHKAAVDEFTRKYKIAHKLK